MKISNLIVDKKACSDGVWVNWIQGVKLKIARFYNPKHVALSKELSRPYRDAMNNGGEIPREKIEEMATECLAKTILLDWKGMEDDDGIEVPFSQDKALELLTMIPDMADFVSAMANSANNFRQSALENASKN